MAKYTAATPDQAKWEKLLGSTDWAGLLDPFDEDLREHLLRCGSFCQVAIDAFIFESQSKYHGKCRYSPADILHKILFKQTADYVLDASKPDAESDYLHTTVDLYKNKHETNWMGFVAVSSDELYNKNGRREIYVAWRGTYRPLETVEDFNCIPVPFGPEQGGVKIMKGWKDIYTTPAEKIPSAQDKLREVIRKYVEKYKAQNPSIICIGHSLGGALAVVSAFDIASSVLSHEENYIQVCAVAFEGPRVGNKAFNEALKKLKNTKVFRVNNNKDIVPKWPFIGYVDSGTSLDIDSEKSTFLKSQRDYEGDQHRGKVSQWHEIQVILHTVTGWMGKDTFDNESEQVKERLPLVNRSAGHLKTERGVIEAWWVEKNNGMVYDLEADKWYESDVPRD